MDTEGPRGARLEIAHVLFLDIVGYSRLPMDQQAHLLRGLQEIIRGSEQFQEAQAKAQLISLPTGDGMALVFFGSPEDPVECAMEIGRALRTHPDLPLRMGVHTGPVYRVSDINLQMNVSGGGINIAQRVMDCGDAGHILVSKAVADVLGQLSGWVPLLHSLGEVEVKHGLRVDLFNLYTDAVGNAELPRKVRAKRADEEIAARTSGPRAASPSRRPRALTLVAALAITAAIGGGTWWMAVHRQRTAPGDATSRSTAQASLVLAVVPFTSIADDTSRKYFAEGLTEEISAQLSRLSSLRMMSRAAVARYTESPATLRRIGAELGVTRIVAGSVRLAGDRARIDVQLVDAASDQTLWSEQYDRRLQDILGVQSDVAGQIALKLQGRLSSSEQERLGKMPTSNAPAYELYLRATQLPSWVRTSNTDAIELLREALRLDSRFSLAYAQLANRLGFLGDYGDHRSYADALQAARQAVESDPSEVRAQHALAVTQMRLGRLAEARMAFLRSVDMDANFANALSDLSITEAILGHFDQSLVWARRAFQRAPNVGVFYYHVGVPLVALAADNIAQEWLLESERRFPKMPRIQFLLADLEFVTGREAAAFTRVKRAALANPDDQEVQSALVEFSILMDAPDAPKLVAEWFQRSPDGRVEDMLPETFRTLHAFLLDKRHDPAAGTLLDAALESARNELAAGSENPEIPMEMAAIYALRDDRAAALKWLDAGYLAGWRLYRETARDPLFAKMRSDPQFRSILEKMEADVTAMRKRAAQASNPAMPPVSVTTPK